jgi:hypothetical protein
MPRSAQRLRISIIENDDRLRLDLEAVASKKATFEAGPPVDGAADIVLIDIATTRALEQIRKLAAYRRPPKIIAVGERGIGAWSLEYSLTLAEVRGATLALIRPISAFEIMAVLTRLGRPPEGETTQAAKVAA